MKEDSNIKECVKSRRYYSDIDSEKYEDVDNFLTRIGRYPIIPRAEESEIISHAKDGDVDSLEKLIMSNLRFCVAAVIPYQHKDLKFMELVRMAEHSLADAVLIFNERDGEVFTIYAVSKIKESIQNSLVHT